MLTTNKETVSPRFIEKMAVYEHRSTSSDFLFTLVGQFLQTIFSRIGLKKRSSVSKTS